MADGGVQVVQRTAVVLRALADAPSGLRLGHLIDAVALPKSTVHRLVAALEGEGFVAMSDGLIRLGPLVGHLGAASQGSMLEAMRPFLRALSEQLRETIDLAVLDGPGVRFVDQVAGPQRLRAVSAVGETFPLHCTANGKALLATLPRREASALLPRRLPRLTPATITSRERLWAELEAVRRTGVAFDREEHTEGICAVGAAVGDVFGTTVAVSIPLPSLRFHGRERALAGALRRTVDAARALGV